MATRYTGMGLRTYDPLLNGFNMPTQGVGLNPQMTAADWLPNNMDNYTLGYNNQAAQAPGFGFNMPTLQLGLTGLSTLAGIFNSFSQNKQQRDQFDYYRRMADTNMNNSIQNYNTRLEDRARARIAAEGGTQEDLDAYLAKNRLSR